MDWKPQGNDGITTNEDGSVNVPEEVTQDNNTLADIINIASKAINLFGNKPNDTQKPPAPRKPNTSRNLWIGAGLLVVVVVVLIVIAKRK